MGAEEVAIWLKLQELIVMTEWSVMQRDQASPELTEAARHMREAGHALRFGCCKRDGGQLEVA